MSGRWYGVVVALGAAALAGCGAPTGESRHDGDGGETRAVEVVLAGAGRGSEGRWRLHVDLLADGAGALRVTQRATGFAPMTMVYDGTRLLEHSSEDGPPWTLYEAPLEHPQELAAVLAWRPDPASPAFDEICHDATAAGARTMLGRRAHGYHCAATHRDRVSSSAFTIWLDDRTGVLVQAPFVSAVEVDEEARVDSTAFATTPPAHAEVRVIGSHGTPGADQRPAPNFELPLVGGGTATLEGYADRPLVLVFWASDLAFGESEECPRCRSTFRTLHALASRPGGPAVLVVVTGDPGKPGYPLRPDSPGLPIANDPGEDVKDAYGLTGLAGLALVDSAGDVVRTFERPPSDVDLRAAVAALR